jgi:coenzyme PQQ precursor peptide PqqA
MPSDANFSDHRFSAFCHLFLSEFLNVAFRDFSWTSHAASIADRHYPIRKFTGLKSSPKETIMKEWLKPEITESEAGMEVTSYLPAELDRA